MIINNSDNITTSLCNYSQIIVNFFNNLIKNKYHSNPVSNKDYLSRINKIR